MPHTFSSFLAQHQSNIRRSAAQIPDVSEHLCRYVDFLSRLAENDPAQAFATPHAERIIGIISLLLVGELHLAGVRRIDPAQAPEVQALRQALLAFLELVRRDVPWRADWLAEAAAAFLRAYSEKIAPSTAQQ